jgi:class 3 adenylate cyclase
MGDATLEKLAAGREAFARHEWEPAYELLSASDAESPLGPEDLEMLANAARWARHHTVTLDAFERAEGSFAAMGDNRGAARAALELAWEQYLRNNDAVASGWHGRAALLLENDTECAEYALFLMLSGYALVMGGNLEAGRDLLEQARDTARRVGDPDTENLARLFVGHAFVTLGDTKTGLAMVDEATAAAMSGQLGVQAAGSIYCSTIVLCRNIGDWRRASEWTDASLRWCRRESVGRFPGLCSFHHAEVMRFRGELADAEQDAIAASEELMNTAPRWAGWAYHELGEVRRRRGNLGGAAEAFRLAAAQGFDPQPGLARLRLDEGDAAGAQRAIRRAVADDALLSQESLGHALPVQVTIEIAAGDLGAARSALEALESRVERSGSSAFAAAASTARGELALAEERLDDAVHELRRALQGWQDVDAPYEGARTRVLLARAYRAEGDDLAADLELEGAQSTFDRIGAARDSARIAALLAKPTDIRAVRTFMFTDIVGSTRLVELLGDDAWENLLAWHDRSLRTCFERHGGEEVKHEGDGFFVAFPDPASAIECARHIQRSLADHRRDHGFAPQVRIGVHTAEAIDREGDYGGKGVHTAARIGASAAADEIVASAATLDGLDGRFTTLEERALALKGLTEPVPVVTVDWR